MLSVDTGMWGVGVAMWEWVTDISQEELKH